MSRRETLTLLLLLYWSLNRSSCSLVNPILGWPSIKAHVAGIAPLSLIIFSVSVAMTIFWGYGKPCVIIVDSNETTGLDLSFNACWTSSDILNGNAKLFFDLELENNLLLIQVLATLIVNKVCDKIACAPIPHVQFTGNL